MNGMNYEVNVRYHRLNGSSSNVLTATSLSYGKAKNSTPHRIKTLDLPYLTLPPGWTGSYTCPALRPYQLGPMRIPECIKYVRHVF